MTDNRYHLQTKPHQITAEQIAYEIDYSRSMFHSDRADLRRHRAKRDGEEWIRVYTDGMAFWREQIQYWKNHASWQTFLNTPIGTEHACWGVSEYVDKCTKCDVR